MIKKAVVNGEKPWSDMPAAFLSHGPLYLESREAATEEFVTPGALITRSRLFEARSPGRL
jgi:hypothetical protein